MDKNVLPAMLAFAAVACGALVPTTDLAAQPLPEPPTNVHELPPVSNFRAGADGLAYPHFPPFRTSFDGRIGLRVNGRGQVHFFLLGPEEFTGHLLEAPRGVRGVLDRMSLPTADLFPYANSGSMSHFGARTICEKSGGPRACGDDDCYDLTLIGDRDGNGSTSLVSRDVRVRIRNPKTGSAEIADIVPVPGTLTQAIVEGFPDSGFVEPNVTSDGRLFLLKSSSLSADWTWNEPGGAIDVYPRGSRPVLYFYNDDPSSACDVTRWTEPRPLSHAPFDSRINRKYGFARYEFRDVEGNAIANGEQIRGSAYPWLSPEGEMLLLELGGEMLFYSADGIGVSSRYPVSCGDPRSSDNCGLDDLLDTGKSLSGRIQRYERARNVNRAVTAVGLWTHGKFVELDNMLNYMDYAPNGADRQHLDIHIYDGDPQAGTDSVLIAHNKQLGSGPIPDGVDEGAQLGSPVNVWNYSPQMAPVTPRDIVWQVSKGNGITVEVPFDDYVDPHVFINAPMNTSSSNLKYRAVDALREMQGFNNGFRRTGVYTGDGFVQQVRFQNAATGDSGAASRDPAIGPFRFNVPAYGQGRGDIRIEPVALGGVRGKGAWLDGSAKIVFRAPSQRSGWSESRWLYGIFVDSRKGGRQHLFSTPNGLSVDMFPSANQIIFRDGDGVDLHFVDLPRGVLSRKKWAHIAVHVGKTKARLLVNGNMVDEWTIGENSAFLLPGSAFPGTFSIGGDSGAMPGVTGWVDDFKVVQVGFFGEEMELLCNHARGTLVGLDPDYAGRDLERLAMTGGRMHQLIERRLAAAPALMRGRYACYTDYASMNGALLSSLPRRTVSLRSALLQPRTLSAYVERPDETANRFCLSCHVDDHPGTLDVDTALGFRPGVFALDDPRRQPDQPQPHVYGVIPSGLFGGDQPSSTIFLPDGTALNPDEYLLAP